MNTDLLTEARALAERGWLPGITNRHHFKTDLWHETEGRYATEADLHLAAHNEIRRRKWFIAVDSLLQNTTSIDTEMFVTGPTVTEFGTTTLSLLRCLRRACEASEGAKP